MIEICLKYDNVHRFGIINAFNCINNHVIIVIIACYHVSRGKKFRKGKFRRGGNVEGREEGTT